MADKGKYPDKILLPGHPDYKDSNSVNLRNDDLIAFKYKEEIDFIPRKEAIDIINQLSGTLLAYECK